MSNFKDKAARFLYGRYGTTGFDNLNKFLFISYIAIFVISVIVGFFARYTIVDIIFFVLMTLVIAFMFFRLLSKNIYKRSRENQRFTEFWNKIAQFFKMPFLKFRDRKTHKYVKCPSCKKYMRIKKGKGERYINCPMCKHNFKVKS